MALNASHQGSQGGGGRFDESLVNRRADGRFGTKQRAEANLGPGGVDLVGSESPLLLDPAFARHHHAAENVHDLADLVDVAPLPMRLSGDEWRVGVLAGLDPAATSEEIRRATTTLTFIVDQATVVHGAQGRASDDWYEQIISRIRYAQGDLLEQCNIDPADANSIVAGPLHDPTGTLRSRALRSGSLPADAVAAYDPDAPGCHLTSDEWDDIAARAPFSVGHAVLAMRHHPDETTRQRCFASLLATDWPTTGEAEAKAVQGYFFSKVGNGLGPLKQAFDRESIAYSKTYLLDRSTTDGRGLSQKIYPSMPQYGEIIGPEADRRMQVLETLKTAKQGSAADFPASDLVSLDERENASKYWFAAPVTAEVRKEARKARLAREAEQARAQADKEAKRRRWRRD